MTYYPSPAAVLRIHYEAIERFGGAHGVRDWGGLESALGRPQSGYYADIVEEAAALIESLSQNHPFVDGNKRTAVAVGILFLERNGYVLEFDDWEFYQFLIELYENRRFGFRALDRWIRTRIYPRRRRRS